MADEFRQLIELRHLPVVNEMRNGMSCVVSFGLPRFGAVLLVGGAEAWEKMTRHFQCVDKDMACAMVLRRHQLKLYVDRESESTSGFMQDPRTAQHALPNFVTVAVEPSRPAGRPVGRPHNSHVLAALDDERKSCRPSVEETPGRFELNCRKRTEQSEEQRYVG